MTTLQNVADQSEITTTKQMTEICYIYMRFFSFVLALEHESLDTRSNHSESGNHSKTPTNSEGKRRFSRLQVVHHQ